VRKKSRGAQKKTLGEVWLTFLKRFQHYIWSNAIGCVSSLKTYSPARHPLRGFFFAPAAGGAGVVAGLERSRRVR
jgi:hypothetical protein